MGKNSLNDRKATCPFFHSHTAQNVICEGIVDNSTDNVGFSRGGAKKLHFELYCCFKYEQCPRYKPLMEKYGED